MQNSVNVLQYRDFFSLTDEEIVEIVKDIFEDNELKIDNIEHSKDGECINCNVYIMEEYPDYSDTIYLYAWGEIDTHDFEFTEEQEEKYRKWLLAKGCDERLKDNPYLHTIPAIIGDKVYKICPKCNPDHNGTCRNCAWSGCSPEGCDVGVWVYSDGSSNSLPLQVTTSCKVTETNFFTILKWWNIMYFSTQEEAEKALKEYDAIRNIEDRTQRYETFMEWYKSRAMDVSFFKL